MASEFDLSWPEETLRIAYEDCASSREAVRSLADAIDNKVLAIFSVTSAVAGFAPSLHRAATDPSLATQPSPWQTLWYLISGLAWVWVVVQCYRAYKPSGFAVTPRPNVLLDRKWLGLTASQYRFYAIRDAGEVHEVNASLVLERGRLLRSAMIGTIIEIAFLGIAVLGF